MAASVSKILKLSLLGIQGLILICGLIMIIGGSVIQSSINNRQLAQSVGGFQTQAGSIICIIFGIVIVLAAVLGFFAVKTDNYRLLAIYCGVMGVVFVIQFITGVVGLSIKHGSAFPTHVAETVQPKFQIGQNNSETDYYQSFYQCCGWYNYTDYLNTTSGLYQEPSSCCTQASNCNQSLINTQPQLYLYTQGCAISVINLFSWLIEVACGILVAMSVFTLISILLAGGVMYSIRKYQVS